MYKARATTIYIYTIRGRWSAELPKRAYYPFQPIGTEQRRGRCNQQGTRHILKCKRCRNVCVVSRIRVPTPESFSCRAVILRSPLPFHCCRGRARLAGVFQPLRSATARAAAHGEPQPRSPARQAGREGKGGEGKGKGRDGDGRAPLSLARFTPPVTAWRGAALRGEGAGDGAGEAKESRGCDVSSQWCTIVNPVLFEKKNILRRVNSCG